MKYIPLSIPNLKGNELKYVKEAIESEWVSTGGQYINQFEDNIADFTKAKGAVAVQSGTAGLQLAMQLSNVTYDDEVICPTLTFIAAINPIKYLGAKPIFMDCDDSLNIDFDKVEKFCEEQCVFEGDVLVNKNTNKKIKALVVVHVFGNYANIERAMEIGKKYNLKVIEDATEALGTICEYGKYKGKFAGTLGDFGVYSFNGNKIMTTGGGGMIVSNHSDLLEKAKYLSTQAKDDPLFYIHNEIGYNFRMTNVQAAIGVAQLEQLNKFIDIKTENYNYYKEQMKDINNVRILDFNENTKPNYWFYSLVIEDDNKLTRDEYIYELEEKGIQTRPIWGLIHEQKPYVNEQSYEIEKSKYYFDRIINIPCSTNLEKSDIDRIVATLKEMSK